MELQKSFGAPEVVGDVSLTATLPHEMVESQNQLIAWCTNKLAVLKSESIELQEAYAHAKRSKWKTSVLYAHWQKSLKREIYYDKMKQALEAGFYIIPNFPVTMFAIRTKKNSPDGKMSTSYWGSKTQDAMQLPAGEGEYKNPEPIVERETTKWADNTTTSHSVATDWQDIEFPITMAKPFIMEATSRAMALNIFDQFGIMPPTRNDDPVIIGQIRMKNGYSEKVCSFMIAWFLNTKVL